MISYQTIDFILTLLGLLGAAIYLGIQIGRWMEGKK
jgi:hypothetical protein